MYLAEQLSADGFSRIIAIKLLHAKWSSHDEVVMRTRDEARLLGLIRHQHIVKVEDLTSIDGKCAIVMEYLEGVDLKAMMTFLPERNLVFPRKALFEIVLAVASALDAAYNGVPLQGGQPLRLIHRDIKPSNIFVTINGGIKLLDFGTARANFAQREAKTQALAFGSQGYMAPERMLGEEDTPAADIFSLGITLYELLALESIGRIPVRPNKFQAKMDEKVAAVPLEGDPQWVEKVRTTLRRMLSYEPTDRPTATELVELMDELAGDADDMGFRKFCRTLITECQQTQPELETGDPLMGETVDEDVSSAFARPTAEAPPPPQGYEATPAPAQPIEPAPPPPAPRVATAAPTPAPQQRAQAPVIHGPTNALPEPEGASSGGGGRLVLVALVLGVLGLGCAGVAGGGYYAWSSGLLGGSGTPSAPSAPAPAAPAVEAPELPSGGRVTSEDSRADAPKIKTKLAMSDPSKGADVSIVGGVGFKAEWDGKDSWEVDLASGSYRTNVQPVGGKKIRAKSFQVDDGAKGCSFTFDLAKEDWSGSCE